MFAYQAYDLKEKTKYDFQLKHFCKGQPTQMSHEVSASATTLDKCRLIILSKRTVKIVTQQISVVQSEVEPKLRQRVRQSKLQQT